MIDTLFHGLLHPAGRNYGRDRQYASKLQKVVDAEAALRAVLNKDATTLLEAYVDCAHQLGARISEMDFREGFVVAFTLVMDVHTHPENHPDSR